MRTLFAIAAASGLCLTIAAADDGIRHIAEPKSQIVLEGCRIALIDQAKLASDRIGVLAEVQFVEGDRVDAGQLVARVRDEVAAAALAVAEKQASDDIEIRFGEASAEVAEAEYQKAIRANEIGGTRLPIIPAVEVDRLRLAATRGQLQTEKAQHDVEVAKLERNRAEAELATFRVLAPFTGTVINVYKKAGEAVNQGDPILDIVNTDRVRVIGDIHVSDMWSVKAGDRVEVQLVVEGAEIDIEQEVFEGKISFIDPSVAPGPETARIWAEVKNRDGLIKAGLRAKMTIFPQTKPEERELIGAAAP